MTETEIKELIKNVTVKIEVSIGGTIEKSTGVLIKQNDKLYVLTVYHCIYGKAEPYHNTQVQNISFRFEQDVTSYTIKPNSIMALDKNLVLLEINGFDVKNIEFKCLDRVYDEKKYYLRGFPNSEVHNFEAKCNEANFDDVTFKIEVDNLTSDTSGENAVNFISGLSGGGVFFSENNHLYLVGLVNELRDKFGRFNVLHCTKLVDLHHSDIRIVDFYTINDISQKLKKINTAIANEACAEYQNDNTYFYDNLNRKHSNIFNENEVNDKNFKAIQNYLQGKNTISEIKFLDTSFENNLVTFINEILSHIETYITTYIDSKQEGRLNLTTIRTKVLESINSNLELIRQETYVSSKLQEYIVVGWLLNCNVDFILEDE